MYIRFTCKSCQQPVAVDTSFARKYVLCIQCGRSQQVPRNSTIFISADDETTDIAFMCLKCGKNLVVDETGAGLVIPCPSCAFRMFIPRKCPFCTLIVPTTASSCTHCGSKLGFGETDSIGSLDFSGGFRNSIGARYTIARGST